jgi:hypothetical protein
MRSQSPSYHGDDDVAAVSEAPIVSAVAGDPRQGLRSFPPKQLVEGDRGLGDPLDVGQPIRWPIPLGRGEHHRRPGPDVSEPGERTTSFTPGVDVHSQHPDPGRIAGFESSSASEAVITTE